MAYDYQSDTTQFINGLLADNPQLQQQRLDNRNLLWDVELDADEQAGFQAAAVAKKPYTYQTD